MKKNTKYSFDILLKLVTLTKSLLQHGTYIDKSLEKNLNQYKINT